MRFIKIHTLFFLFFSANLFSQNNLQRGSPPAPQNLPPDVHFSWNAACLGDTVCFINQSIRADTYTWTVMDTLIGWHLPPIDTLFVSNDTNFCFHFPGPGTYSVSLHAYNNHDVTLTKIIKIDTLVKADFSFVGCSNQFTNTSLCATLFNWDFGDGNTSSVQCPVHQYANTGPYNVKLIAKNGNKTDTLTKTIQVAEIAFAAGAFTYTVSYDTIFVHATYPGTANFYWHFGDPTGNNFATGRDTLHVYKDSVAGYGVGLTVINQCGPAYGADSVKITLDSTITPAPGDTSGLPSHLVFTSNLTIVPNPANGDNINVYYNSYNSGDYLARVYNTLGEKLFEEYFSFDLGINGFKIPSSQLAEGTYILVLQSENIYARRKLLVIRHPD